MLMLDIACELLEAYDHGNSPSLFLFALFLCLARLTCAGDSSVHVWRSALSIILDAGLLHLVLYGIKNDEGCTLVQRSSR